MCGILGSVARDECRDAESVAAYIRNRGPDGLAVRNFRVGGWHLSLVHTRLAIIDLHDRSNQPMDDPSGRWTLAYNGELYNYRELRDERIAAGGRFITEGDTEVLLDLWAARGIDALSLCNGMFAFAVVDKEAGTVTLVRDRFGVKPLVWGRRHDGGLVYSSSVAAVAKLVGDEPDAEYCARGCFYGAFERNDTRTPFRHVHSVPPGGFVRVWLEPDGLRIEEGAWYDLHSAVAKEQGQLRELGEHQLIERCTELLSSSVALRLRSDVALGCSLSGGLDSSTIAAIAAKTGVPLRTFSFGHPDAGISEGPIVERFSRHVGFDTSYVWPSHSAADIHNSLERTLRAQEAPFTTLSIVAQQEVFAAVREAGVKVLLGGQGGDESFAGYRKFALVAAREALAAGKRPDAFRYFYSFGRMLLAELGSMGRYIAMIPRYFGRKPPQFELLGLPISTEVLLGAAGDGLAKRQILDITRWSLPTLLRYEDRNSMANGLETRLPFLDYRLMQTALALPGAMKIRNGYAKWALRDVADGLVPDHIRLARGKRGFDMAQDWIGAGMGDFLRESILPAVNGGKAPFLKNTDQVRKLLADESLQRSPNLVAEALVSLWMLRPVREPVPALQV